MWTDRHRTRHETRLKDMVLQVGLDEVARFLERADPPGRSDATPVRQVLAGIAWHLRTGGGWRDLPARFPPWRTVYGWFRRWVAKGLFEALMRVALLGQGAAHVMGAAAGLHRNDTPRQLRAEGDHPLAPHASAQHDPPRHVQPDEAAAVLAQVDPKNRNRHRPAPFLISATLQA